MRSHVHDQIAAEGLLRSFDCGRNVFHDVNAGKEE
jgi:hypothetical protein